MITVLAVSAAFLFIIITGLLLCLRHRGDAKPSVSFNANGDLKINSGELEEGRNDNSSNEVMTEESKDKPQTGNTYNVINENEKNHIDKITEQNDRNSTSVFNVLTSASDIKSYEAKDEEIAKENPVTDTSTEGSNNTSVNKNKTSPATDKIKIKENGSSVENSHALKNNNILASNIQNDSNETLEHHTTTIESDSNIQDDYSLIEEYQKKSETNEEQSAVITNDVKDEFIKKKEHDVPEYSKPVKSHKENLEEKEDLPQDAPEEIYPPSPVLPKKNFNEIELQEMVKIAQNSVQNGDENSSDNELDKDYEDISDANSQNNEANMDDDDYDELPDDIDLATSNHDINIQTASKEEIKQHNTSNNKIKSLIFNENEKTSSCYSESYEEMDKFQTSVEQKPALSNETTAAANPRVQQASSELYQDENQDDDYELIYSKENQNNQKTSTSEVRESIYRDPSQSEFYEQMDLEEIVASNMSLAKNPNIMTPSDNLKNNGNDSEENDNKGNGECEDEDDPYESFDKILQQEEQVQVFHF